MSVEALPLFKPLQLNRRFTVFPGLSRHFRVRTERAFSVARRIVISHGPTNPTAVVEPSNSGAVTDDSTNDPPVRIVSIVGHGSLSPLKGAPWEEVMLHTAKRLTWVEEGYKMLVFNDNWDEPNSQKCSNLQRELRRADILVTVGVTNPESVNWINSNARTVRNVICFDSSPGLSNKLGGDSFELVKTVTEAWDRRNSDDIRFCILVIINAYVRPVSVLKNLRSKGFATLNCMVKNCGPQILNCLLDPNCRKALQCLNNCSPVDQVCNYRCIASYESPSLEAFSLCVLQRNNCLELDAEIPKRPRMGPMSTFRGRDFSHELAEDIFVGWLGNLDWSWRVVAGQNPAYDQFPCQYQLFYRGKSRGSFWYEPVFQVKKLEGGGLVWRRRKYRVKRGQIPGTFFFTVLDNGVVSEEFWTVVDSPDDLSWGLFHYHGAARAAGQSYTGAVLVSPDGKFPSGDVERVVSALERCGIKDWELFTVDNCQCLDPPLGVPEGSSFHSVIEIPV